MGIYLRLFWACRDLPALHDHLQKAVFDQALPMSPSQISRTHSNDTDLLQGSKDCKGFGQLSCGLAITLVLSLAYLVVS